MKKWLWTDKEYIFDVLASLNFTMFLTKPHIVYVSKKGLYQKFRQYVVLSKKAKYSSKS